MINLRAEKASQRIKPEKLFKLPQDKKSNLPQAKPLSKDELDNLIDKWNVIEKKGKKRKL
tara:strand:- start:482 stop:661 length:180 start_codon:yes stop_codon:yes gene_type:complete